MQLHYDETELLDVLGVPPEIPDPEVNEGAIRYRVARDDLTLELWLEPDLGIVSAYLFRDGVNKPIATYRYAECSHIVVRQMDSGQRCLKIGLVESNVTDPSISPRLIRGLRLTVDPHITLEPLET